MAPPLTGSSLIRNSPTQGSGQDQLAFELAAGAVPENIQRRAAQPTQAGENLERWHHPRLEPTLPEPVMTIARHTHHDLPRHHHRSCGMMARG
jgi:hypothetical protein